MNCQQITKIITDISGFQKTLDLAIKKEVSIKDGLGSKRNIKEMVDIAIETDATIKLKFAEKLFGQDFMGPSEIKAAFLDQVEISEVPAIPFSREDLKRAKELGQMLILRVNKAKDGSDLTMEKINSLLDGKIKDVEVLFPSDWYKEEDFYKAETPEVAWALVSKEVVPDSTSKNYLEQTEVLVKYLKEKVFKGKALPAEYEEAIKEFEREKAGIAATVSSNTESEWKEVARKLEALKLNQLTRQSPVEALYDVIVRYQQTGERLLENTYTRTKRSITKRRGSVGSLVCVGYFRSDGVGVYGLRPGYADGGLGVSFSRSR